MPQPHLGASFGSLGLPDLAKVQGAELKGRDCRVQDTYYLMSSHKCTGKLNSYSSQPSVKRKKKK